VYRSKPAPSANNNSDAASTLPQRWGPSCHTPEAALMSCTLSFRPTTTLPPQRAIRASGSIAERVRVGIASLPQKWSPARTPLAVVTSHCHSSLMLDFWIADVVGDPNLSRARSHHRMRHLDLPHTLLYPPAFCPPIWPRAPRSPSGCASPWTGLVATARSGLRPHARPTSPTCP
jgi:hypothetical protein